MNDLPGTLDQLTARLEALEKRVYALENPAAVSTADSATEAALSATDESAGGLSLAQGGGLFPVLGRAMLGIAGAYLLRAIAESTSLPKRVVAASAIVYALLWLVGAARAKAATWVASAIYAGTSALILAPMLWELTLSFDVLPPVATAAVLGAFAMAASALAWKRDLAPVLWVAHVTAAAAALVLARATHQLLPFIAVLLLMVLLCEISADFNHALNLRPFVAAAADLGIWAMIFIYSGPQTARVDYPALGTAALLAPGCLVFLIAAASVVLRTTVLAQNITVFETLQAIVAFLLAASSVLYFAPHFGSIGLGVLCLLLAAACYALVFAVFRGFSSGRNPQVYAAWGAGLLLTGSLWGLSPLGVALSLGLAAIAATLLGVRSGRLTLEVHGLLLLVSVAVASGLLGYALNVLAGTLPDGVAAAVFVAAACTVVCYASGKPDPMETWKHGLLHLIPAALAVCSLAALLVQGLLALLALGIAPALHHVAFIRTLVLCAVALSTASAGSRWHRQELTRIAYAALALVAVKLVFEDLRHGRLEFIAAAFFLFALTLISVPRLARTSRKA
ncbi:MAG: hypothetical protein P4L26_04260 [Terracidiphilus sp.]|nr:hypothetical protein [Terracidiphilus sp.]